jgi:hypothetical protein
MEMNQEHNSDDNCALKSQIKNWFCK